jgi:hypothetical protein
MSGTPGPSQPEGPKPPPKTPKTPPASAKEQNSEVVLEDRSDFKEPDAAAAPEAAGEPKDPPETKDLFGRAVPVPAPELLNIVEDRVRGTRTQSFDISVGEILSIYERDELIIHPEFQRLFRWSIEKQSRFIESLLLEIPVPPIFVIETENGVYELIDGLQRLTSVMNFFNGEHPLVLTGCDIVQELNGHTAATLPLALRLRVKRVPMRMVVVKRESQPHAKFEMFYRLNTGGEIATPQEVRNCVIRILDNTFNQFIIDRSLFPPYRECIRNFSDNQIKQLYDQELVLRFFAFKNRGGEFRHDIGEFLTDYLIAVTEKREIFDYGREATVFEKTFAALASIDGEFVFCRINEAGTPVRRATPNFFEAFALGIQPHLEKLRLTDEVRRKAIHELFRRIRVDQEFLAHTGPGSNAPAKLEARIQHVSQKLAAIL